MYCWSWALSSHSLWFLPSPRSSCAPWTLKFPSTAGTDEDVLPGTWLTYGLTQTEQRYSQLTGIDESNVGELGLAWSAPLVGAQGGRGGTEGTPLMWNDTIYQPMDNSISG